MRNFLISTSFLILTLTFITQKANAASAVFADGYIFSRCDTCVTDYDFRAKTSQLRITYGAGTYLIFNGVFDTFKTLTVSSNIFQEGPETIVFYVSTIVPNTSATTQKFNNYLTLKAAGFPEIIDVTIPDSFSTTTEELYGSTSKALLESNWFTYFTIPLGTVINVTTSDNKVVILMVQAPAGNSSTVRYYTLAAFDANGDLIPGTITAATSSSGGGGGLYFVHFPFGNYTFCVSESCGLPEGGPIIIKPTDDAS